MKPVYALFAAASMALLVAAPQPAEAKGCIKGAIVGGIAGWVVGHGKAGAIAGCAIGYGRAQKQQDIQRKMRQEDEQQFRQMQPEHPSKWL